MTPLHSAAKKPIVQERYPKYWEFLQNIRMGAAKIVVQWMCCPSMHAEMHIMLLLQNKWYMVGEEKKFLASLASD